MAIETVTLSDLGDRLEDARTVLDFMTDVEPGDTPEARQLHRGALTAFRLVADALETLAAVEARG